MEERKRNGTKKCELINKAKRHNNAVMLIKSAGSGGPKGRVCVCMRRIVVEA